MLPTTKKNSSYLGLLGVDSFHEGYYTMRHLLRNLPFRILYLPIVILLILSLGCGSLPMTPSVSHKDLALTPQERKIPLKAAVVFSKQFESYKVTDAIDKETGKPMGWPSNINVKVGKSSVKLFKKVLPLMFENVEFFSGNATPKNCQVLIRPEIREAIAYGDKYGTEESQIKYGISLLDRKGNIIFEGSAEGISGYYGYSLPSYGIGSVVFGTLLIVGTAGTVFTLVPTFVSIDYSDNFAKAEAEAVRKLMRNLRSSSTLMAYATEGAKPPYLVVNAVLEDGDKHRVIEAGEKFALNVDVENKGSGTAYGVKVEVNASSIGALREDKFVGDIEPKSKKSVSFETMIPYSLKTGNYSFTIKTTDQWEKYSSQPLELVVAVKALVPPQFKVKAEIDDDLIGHSAGNANGVVEKGETIEIHLAIENIGKGEAKEVLATIRPKVKGMDLVRDKISLGNLPSGGKVEGVLAFAIPTNYTSDKMALDIAIEERTGLFTARTAREFAVYEPSKKKRLIGGKVAKGEEIKAPPAEFTFETKMAEPLIVEIDKVPKRRVKCKEGYAIVIGIEKYRDLPQVEFAQRDAQVLREYLIKTMGFPEANIVTLLNERALRSDLGKYFETWLKNNISKDSTLFIYYAGHGAPGLKGDKAYLVPYDGDPNYPETTCYSLYSLYASLNKLPAKQTIVALDSCFSGAGGRSVVAEGSRPMYISVENPMLASGNIVVLTAATEKQIASFYPEAKHGLFTYFLLKGLRGDGDLDGDGWVELKELFDYLKPEVKGIARRMNREQTPVILPSIEILGKRGEYRLTKAE